MCVVLKRVKDKIGRVRHSTNWANGAPQCYMCVVLKRVKDKIGRVYVCIGSMLFLHISLGNTKSRKVLNVIQGARWPGG